MVIGNIDCAGDRLPKHGSAEAQTIAFPALLSHLQLSGITRTRIIQSGPNTACCFCLAVLVRYDDDDGIHCDLPLEFRDRSV